MRNAIRNLAVTLVFLGGLGCEPPPKASDLISADGSADGSRGDAVSTAASSASPPGTGTGAPSAGPVRPAPQVRTQAPGFYRMMLGDFEITALSDGTVSPAIEKLLTNAKPGEVDSLVARTFQKFPLELSVNAYLINTGSKLVMVDTGAGESFGPKEGGRLVSSLRAAGYSPEQVDAILLTHAHGDHLGGLFVGGKMVFPNAQVYLHKAEKDYWLSAAEAEKAKEMEKPMFAGAHAALDPYIAAGKVSTFDAAAELFPGISTIPAPGHTPGSTFYSVESKGQKLLLWGDVVHMAEVQFPNPAVTVQFDHDSKAAGQQRAKIFADAAKQGYWVGSAHISFPGIGHIRAEGASYVWMPATYSLRL